MRRIIRGLLATLIIAVLAMSTLIVWPVTLVYGWRRRRRLARWAGKRPGQEGWFV